MAEPLSNEEKAKRLNAVERALKSGASHSEVERTAAAKWGISAGEASKLVAEAASAVQSPAPTRKKSGGARAVEAKHRERDAERPAGYSAREIGSFRRAIAKAKTPLEKSVAGLIWAQARAGTDPGMPPEYRREQVLRTSQALGKVADPLKTIADQAQLLALAEERIEQLEERLRGASKSSGDRGESSEASLQ